MGPGFWLVVIIGVLAAAMPIIGNRPWAFPVSAAVLGVTLVFAGWKWSIAAKDHEFAQEADAKKGGIVVEFSMEHDRGVYYDRGVVWLTQDSIRFEGKGVDVLLGGPDIDPAVEISSKAGRTALIGFRSFNVVFEGVSRRCGIQALKLSGEKDDDLSEKRVSTIEKVLRAKKSTTKPRLMPPLVRSQKKR